MHEMNSEESDDDASKNAEETLGSDENESNQGGQYQRNEPRAGEIKQCQEKNRERTRRSTQIINETGM
jgi:hypothetical protein